MSAVTRTRLAPAPATVAGPVTQVRVVRAEWTKLRALRSTWWCGLSAVVLIVGLGAAIAGSGAPYHVSAGNSAATGVSAALLGVCSRSWWSAWSACWRSAASTAPG
jgi:hypothetical protein